MKSYLLLVLGALFFSACQAVPQRTSAKHIQARITYYSAHEDKYGSKIAMGGRAKEGITCAAAPGHPFGQHVVIPKLAGVVGDGTFVVQDRGSAVTKRKASHGVTEVIDIFLAGTKKACKKRMVELTRKIGYYTDVIIF
jgi:hypothetical protein